MLYLYYKTSYHPDGYLVGRVYCNYGDWDSICIYSYAHYDPNIVHSMCSDYVMEHDLR